MSHFSLSPMPAAMMYQLGLAMRLNEPLPDPNSPVGRLTREIFKNNWCNCQEGLLRRTSVIQLIPEPSPWPRVFQFLIHVSYKRKLTEDSPVELVPGPIRGAIHYRTNLVADRTSPAIAVQVDPALGYFHPNHGREQGHGFVCLGDLPSVPYPFPLDRLLETYVYPILSYQIRRPSHPLDGEAARYFALDPSAMDGLEPVPPLY